MAFPSVASILKDGDTHVLPVHAEVEGGIWSSPFIELIEQIKDYGLPVRDPFRNTKAVAGG